MKTPACFQAGALMLLKPVHGSNGISGVVCESVMISVSSNTSTSIFSSSYSFMSKLHPPLNQRIRWQPGYRDTGF